MEIINPKKLKKGDIVSIISPSAGLAPFVMHRIERAKKNLEDIGLKIIFEKNSLNNLNYVSASVKDRVSDIHSAFKNKKVKAIICSIGGNHSNQLLKYIDWKIIKNNPKIFLGYSDITVLHLAIRKKTGLRTFYGPCFLTELGEYPDIDKYNKKYFIKTLMEGNLSNIFHSKGWTEEFLNWFTKDDEKRKRIYIKNNGFEWWRKGKAEGEIIGGAIPSINHLSGTEYWNDFKDKILFIDLPEGNKLGKGISVADIDTYLTDLNNLNVFDNIKALIIGRAYGQTDKDLKSIRDIFINITRCKKYPILYGVDIGHTTPMITLPIGVLVNIDSAKNSFKVKSKFID